MEKRIALYPEYQDALKNKKSIEGLYKIADIYIGELNTAVEIQCSWINPEDLEEKKRFYKKCNIKLLIIAVTGLKEITRADIAVMSPYSQVIIFNNRFKDIHRDINKNSITALSKLDFIVQFYDGDDVKNERCFFDNLNFSGEMVCMPVNRNNISKIDSWMEYQKCFF